MENINLYAGWIGIFLGFVSGAVPGMFFYKEDWLGGYASWRRRMIRLGHIAFFGIGFINLAYALTLLTLNHPGYPITSIMLIIGAISMPVVCYLSAFRMYFRHLFFIPVLSLVLGVGVFLYGVLFE
ncbi:MAG: hypothetical protein V3V99_02870 [candidate division Zixibacteria bacterium]